MTDLRLSRSQCEKAFAAYVNNAKNGTPFSSVPVNVRMGTIDVNGQFVLANLNELPLPLIAIACPRAERHDAGFPECQLHVIMLGSIDPEQASEKHTALVGWVAQLFAEENLAAIRTAMNKPESPSPDLRGMKDFRLFGFLATDDLSQETDRAYIDDFTFKVHCQPTDDTSL